jgi:hypothetical protein
VELSPEAAAACQPAQSVVSEDHAKVGGFYLRQRHGSIHRHCETISINPDHTAHWELKVDFELPTDAQAHCLHDEGECRFLFPLAYLKKSDPRTGFKVQDRDGELVSVPTRGECDWVSSVAAAEAGNWLTETEGGPRLNRELLVGLLQEIPMDIPFESSRKISVLLSILEPENPEFALDPKLMPNLSSKQFEEFREWGAEIGRIWKAAGLTEVLRMLIEHSMVWVPLRGQPGERRSIRISQDIDLVRRPFLRWSFGKLGDSKDRKQHARWEKGLNSHSVLDTGESLYGRRAYRISFSALGQRIGQPLAWTPVEYQFPTIYTRRCHSYHFELACPLGLSPRDLKIGRGNPIDESHSSGQLEDGADGPGGREETGNDPDEGRTTLMPRIAHHYRPGNRSEIDLWFRATVGVAAGAFPVLWFLAGAITAVLLWVLAGADPTLSPKTNGIEIAAGILLVVPAMIAALAIGGDDAPITRLIGGSRILLLTTGLSAVIATAVLIHAKPFHIGQEWMWTACAMVATAAAVPLATSWVLSSSIVWGQLKKLRSAEAQYRALLCGILLAEVVIVVLLTLNDGPIGRAEAIDAPVVRTVSAILLLLFAIGMTVLANNRAAIGIGGSRRYAAASLFAAALTCLALACIELKTAISEPSRLQSWAEVGAFLALLLAWYAGAILSILTYPYHQADDEIHVPPSVGRALVAGERVRELIVLRRREATSEVGHQAG